MIKEITAELQQAASSELAAHHQRFFKTEQGEYGEGDLFLGLKVPQIRTIAKKYTKTAQAENLAEMLQSPYHEVRLAALVIMLEKFAKGSREIREQMHQIYMDNLHGINNWDLVDISAGTLVGEFAFPDTSILWKLARSQNLWQERISVIAISYFIKQGICLPTAELAEFFLDHPHDLMHKACGWMLREAGKSDIASLRAFLNKYSGQMPRTMLRYALEKMDITERKRYMTQKNLTW